MRSIFFLYLFLLLPIWAKTPVSLLKEISVELSKLDDGLIKKLIEERVKEAWALTSDLEKEAALSDLLRELRKVNPVENELALNLGKEIELCNYLIQQACILEALDGAGVNVIKDDLTGNLNDHGLSRDSKRLLRRLVQLCDEASKSYKDVDYVKLDGSDAKADLLTENIGTGLGFSLAMGDVTPLIAAAVKIGTGYNAINKTESRQLDILLRAHQGRIVNFLFNVNSYKNDLIAEQGVAEDKIITPDWYRKFLQALGEKELAVRLKKVMALVESFPEFPTAKFYLANLYYEAGKFPKSEALISSVIRDKSLLLRKDGLRGQAYFLLSKIHLKSSSEDLALENVSMSILENSLNPFALDFRSMLYMKKEQNESAFTDSKKAHELLPDNIDLYYRFFKTAVLKSKSSEIDKLQKLLALGFGRIEELSDWEPYKTYRQQWEVKFLLTPQLKAIYKPGLFFKDDIWIQNVGAFSLRNIQYSLDVKYLKKEMWEGVSVKGKIPFLKKGETFKLKKVFGMPRKSKCSISFKYFSAQNSDELDAEGFYNFFGDRENLLDWQYYRQKAYDVYLSANEKNMIINGLLDAEKAVELSFRQEPEPLSILAHLHFKLGEKKKAVELQQEAISILKKKYSEQDLPLLAEPYQEALEKFK